MNNEILLSEKIKWMRCERPDEWTMDEYIRDAKKLQAQVAELREALGKLIDTASECDSWESFPEAALDAAYEVLAKGESK